MNKTRKRKTITVLLTVTVPSGMSALQTRREIRSLINDQCNFAADPEDLRVKRCGGRATIAAAPDVITELRLWLRIAERQFKMFKPEWSESQIEAASARLARTRAVVAKATGEAQS